MQAKLDCSTPQFHLFSRETRSLGNRPFKYSAAWARSVTNSSYALLRCDWSIARRIEEGWTVIRVFGQNGEHIQRPRFFKIGNCRRKIDRTAVAPIQITTLGALSRISASSHGRHASISRALGFWWILRFPTARHLKCLTAFVT